MRRAETKRDHGKELIGQSEERPETVDAAERIEHALIKEPAPRADEQHAREKVRGPRARVAQRSP